MDKNEQNSAFLAPFDKNDTVTPFLNIVFLQNCTVFPLSMKYFLKMDKNEQNSAFLAPFDKNNTVTPFLSIPFLQNYTVFDNSSWRKAESLSESRLGATKMTKNSFKT